MAPFIVNHPTLLNNWILAREKALKKVREIKNIKKEDFEIFIDCLKKSLKNITSWNTDSEFQKNKIKQLIIDLNKLLTFVNTFNFQEDHGYNKLYLCNLSMPIFD